MKLINSSHWPSYFLRRMISWICRQYGLPVAKIRQAQFTGCRCAYRGRAWYSRRFLVRVNPNYKHYPISAKYPGLKNTPEYVVNDVVEALVMVTAHELCHIDEFVHRVKMIREAQTEHWAHKVLILFREKRQELLDAWGQQPEYVKQAALKPTVSIVEKRERLARGYLALWQGKLKLAKTKVAKYQRTVRYYERKKEMSNDQGNH